MKTPPVIGCAPEPQKTRWWPADPAENPLNPSHRMTGEVYMPPEGNSLKTRVIMFVAEYIVLPGIVATFYGTTIGAIYVLWRVLR